jgi:hypothetical protein
VLGFSEIFDRAIWLETGLACVEIFWISAAPSKMLEYIMRLKHPIPYEDDPTVRLGQQIGDVLFALLVIYLVWGLFWPMLQRLF